MWAVAAVLVAALVGGGAFLLTRSDDKDSEAKTTTAESVEVTGDSTDSTDDTTGTTKVTTSEVVKDADAVRAECRGVSDAVQAMQDARERASDLEPQTDADVPAARVVLLDILDEGVLAAITHLRPVVTAVQGNDAASAATVKQADAYLVAMDTAEASSVSMRDAIAEAKTIQDLMDAVELQVSDKPLVLEQAKYSLLIQAIVDLDVDCATMVDDLNSSSPGN